MKTLIALSIGLMATLSAQAAQCLVRQHKTAVQINVGASVASKTEGHYAPFADVFKIKGFQVCRDNECRGMNVDVELYSSLLSLHKTKPNGSSEFTTYLYLTINGRDYSSSFVTNDYESVSRAASSRLAKIIPDCNRYYRP